MRQKYSPEMMMEELDIVIQSGLCPRCGAALRYTVLEDEWQAHCPGCDTVWGGSL